MKLDTKDQAESRRIIGRAGTESEASMAQARAGGDGDGGDRIELWGTRIGRWLGVGLLVYVIWWLVDFSSSGGG